MIKNFIIDGKLAGLNEYTKACRSNKYGANTLKRSNEFRVATGVRRAKITPIERYPVTFVIKWFEPNKRRDIDNITFATKFILDALVKLRVLEDDSQKYVKSIVHYVDVDKDNPRVEVKIIEEE